MLSGVGMTVVNARTKGLEPGVLHYGQPVFFFALVIRCTIKRIKKKPDSAESGKGIPTTIGVLVNSRGDNGMNGLAIMGHSSIGT